MTDRNTVLLVEDDEGLRYAFRVALERAGFRVVEASQGDEAVRAINERGDELCFAVLDMLDPKVHGSSLIFHVASTAATLPVVAVTGYPDRVMFADPADRHVVKANLSETGRARGCCRVYRGAARKRAAAVVRARAR